MNHIGFVFVLLTRYTHISYYWYWSGATPGIVTTCEKIKLPFDVSYLNLKTVGMDYCGS